MGGGHPDDRPTIHQAGNPNKFGIRNCILYDLTFISMKGRWVQTPPPLSASVTIVRAHLSSHPQNLRILKKRQVL